MLCFCSPRLGCKTRYPSIPSGNWTVRTVLKEMGDQHNIRQVVIMLSYLSIYLWLPCRSTREYKGVTTLQLTFVPPMAVISLACSYNKKVIKISKQCDYFSLFFIQWFICHYKTAGSSVILPWFRGTAFHNKAANKLNTDCPTGILVRSVFTGSYSINRNLFMNVAIIVNLLTFTILIRIQGATNVICCN